MKMKKVKSDEPYIKSIYDQLRRMFENGDKRIVKMCCGYEYTDKIIKIYCVINPFNEHYVIEIEGASSDISRVKLADTTCIYGLFSKTPVIDWLDTSATCRDNILKYIHTQILLPQLRDGRDIVCQKLQEAIKNE